MTNASENTDGEELVAVPRNILGAACAAIRKKLHAPNTLAQINRYAVHGPALAKPASSPAGGDVRDGALGWNSPEEWEIEQRAFHAAGRDDVPKDVQELVAILWKQYCIAAEPSAALSPSTSAAEPVACGPFGHHPDPSTDFCVEVETLEGWAEDVKAGTRSQWPFWGRLSALLRFVRSDEFAELDEITQRAKATVFELEGRVIAAAVDGQRVRVKPLEWQERPGDEFCNICWLAPGLGDSYTIEERRAGVFDLWLPTLSDGTRYGTREEAVAAAQADYEARIRACLATA